MLAVSVFRIRHASLLREAYKNAATRHTFIRVRYDEGALVLHQQQATSPGCVHHHPVCWFARFPPPLPTGEFVNFKSKNIGEV